MNLNTYQDEARKTAKVTSNDLRELFYVTMGLVGEAGEVANSVKRVIRDHNDTLPPELAREIIDELGDVLWYVSQLAYWLRIDLSSVAELNLQKLAARHAEMLGE